MRDHARVLLVSSVRQCRSAIYLNLAMRNGFVRRFLVASTTILSDNGMTTSMCSVDEQSDQLVDDHQLSSSVPVWVCVAFRGF